MRGFLFSYLYMNVGVGFDALQVLRPSFNITKEFDRFPMIYIQHRLKYWISGGVNPDVALSPQSIYNLNESTNCMLSVLSTLKLVASDNISDVVGRQNLRLVNLHDDEVATELEKTRMIAPVIGNPKTQIVLSG
jgi:hypothetical protein